MRVHRKPTRTFSRHPGLWLAGGPGLTCGANRSPLSARIHRRLRSTIDCSGGQKLKIPARGRGKARSRIEDVSELGAEKKNHGRIVDPYNDHDDRAGRSIRRTDSRFAEIKANEELSDREQ